MSMRDEIKKMKKNYLYQRIIHHINQNQSQYKKEVEKYNKDSRKMIFDKIKSIMKDNDKTISNIEKIALNEMYEYFEEIYKYYRKNNKQALMRLTKISKNILFIKKGQDAIFNFDDMNTETEEIFTINDFIYNYTLEAIDRKLFNKDLFKKDNIEELYDIYLYLIFKIQEPNFIIKLKIMIYTHLYENSDIVGFITKFSESFKIYDNKKTLINLQKSHNEIDLNLKYVSDNVPSFFNSKSEKIDDILNFFTIDNIKNNFIKIEQKHINIKDIFVDNLNIIENKENKQNLQNSSNQQNRKNNPKHNKDSPQLTLSSVQFFSPEFLIVNGLKSNIENCDLEIFNNDNYSVDIFSKFLNLIINEINKSIEQNNFSNDFIKNKLIKFHKDNYLHFISSRLDYNTKISLYSEQKNIQKNDFLKINILNKYQSKKKTEEGNNIKQSNEERNSIKQRKTDIKSNKSNEISIFPSKSILTSSNNSYTDLQKRIADDFEDLININLTEKIKKDKLISLPNLLFFLNLKIPEYDNETNSINFKSVHLDSFNEEKREVNENYFYGCKEIDCIFQNISEKPIDVIDSDYFFTNLSYVKKEKDIQFNKDEENGNCNGFKVNPNSIVFCEIKKSFPNIEHGNEDVTNLIVEENKPEKISKGVNTARNYDNQLIKFIKKFKFFYQVLEDKENESIENIQFVFLYDTLNIANDNYSLIDKMTYDILKQYYERFNYKEIITFQLVFFDLARFNSNNKNIIIEKNKQLEEKDEIIKERDETIKKMDKTIEENKKELENQKNVIFGMLGLNNSVKQIIQNENLNKKNKVEEIYKLNNGIISINIIESYIQKFE